MMLIEETAPAAEALPVAALREHLRLGSGFEGSDDPAEAVALSGFLRAAMAAIEGRTGKVLLSRDFRLQLNDWRDRMAQPLPLAPVTSVAGIEIDDGAGRQTLLEADGWWLRRDDQRPAIMPAGLVLPAIPRLGFVSIRFCAGFGESWAAVPADLAQAVLMLAARYYEDRSFEGTQTALPHGVSALIERWRQIRTLAGRGFGGGAR